MDQLLQSVHMNADLLFNLVTGNFSTSAFLLESFLSVSTFLFLSQCLLTTQIMMRAATNTNVTPVGLMEAQWISMLATASDCSVLACLHVEETT